MKCYVLMANTFTTIFSNFMIKDPHKIPLCKYANVLLLTKKCFGQKETYNKI